MPKSLHRSLEAKMAAIKGAEWESSDSEEEENQVQEEPSSRKTKGGKTQQKFGNQKKKENSKSKKRESIAVAVDVIYIGHLPPALENQDLKQFLGQFGQVVNCRISRSIKSGQPRGYAFCQFSSAETAAVVAETLQGYFLGNRRLVSHLVPEPKPGLFFDTDRAISDRKLGLENERRQRNRNLSNSHKLKEVTTKLVAREQKKRAKLAKMGISYDFPGYSSNQVSDDEQPEGKEMNDSKHSQNMDAVPAAKKPKRKESVGSQGSETSDSKKKKKRKNSEGSLNSVSGGEGDKKTPQKKKSKMGLESKSETKSKKSSKKSKTKRRQSAP